MRYAPILLVLTANSVLADALTISPDGIDSKSTGLTGAGIEIGQLEPGRSAKPDYGIPPEDAASNTNPEQVYFRTSIAQPNEANEEHATLVAGMMIGDDSFGGGAFEGVAPSAKLHSVALGAGLGTSFQQTSTLSSGWRLTSWQGLADLIQTTQARRAG